MLEEDTFVYGTSVVPGERRSFGKQTGERKTVSVEEPFDLCAALEDSVTLLSPLAEERGIRLGLDSSELRHNRVIGNPLHLKQILMNVIDNALKYNRSHGSVFVGQRRLLLGMES